ncbi:MAG: OmpA family protein [Elusimicrobia bacterium]|nr:OmpA family protein [Elusimicrobiota bacterium]MDE2425537.1 OmpA family protein [Elusimicrobiota bacterium]
MIAAIKAQLNEVVMAAMLPLLILGLASGCAHAPVHQASGSSAASASAPTPGAQAVEASVRAATLRAIPELRTVHFAYDSDYLNAQARSILRRNAKWIASHPSATLQVAGHCDQRGTVEYNLALGQRRAKAVRDYLIALGSDGGKIATISYGKERLLCQEMTSSCWRRNRRAETLAAVP